MYSSEAVRMQERKMPIRHSSKLSLELVLTQQIRFTEQYSRLCDGKEAKGLKENEFFININ